MHLAKLLQILCAPETKHHVVHVSAIELAEYLASISAKNTRPCPLKCISSGRWMLYTSTISLELVFGERPMTIGPSGASGAQILRKPSRMPLMVSLDSSGRPSGPSTSGLEMRIL